MTQTRQPKGTPTGGQFAATKHAEPELPTAHVLQRPMSAEQVAATADSDGYITANIALSINVAMDAMGQVDGSGDAIEDLNDAVSERITGTQLLTDLSFDPVSSSNGNTIVSVTANANEYLDSEGIERADADGNFTLSDGSLGNPGCDRCGTWDAAIRSGDEYVCSGCIE